MPDHTATCECGAIIPAGEYAATIYNGVEAVLVCDACWRDPENIATEVTVQVAEDATRLRHPHSVRYADLHPTVQAAFGAHLAESLAARSMADDGIHDLVVARWNDWYAA